MDITIHSLLETSIKYQASDLHLSANNHPILRIAGELCSLKDLPILHSSKVEQMIMSLLDEKQQTKFKNSAELDFSVVIPALGQFRVNAFQQLHGISAVFRIIPQEIPSLQQLAAPTILQQLLALDHGLIIVSGPTGSGKSTTLAAMIDHINVTQACHIITIEDPIEFIHRPKKSLIHQRQVFRDTISFRTALRSALREDPDVILIGEIRDLVTMRLALTAAETGHLVLATLHSGSVSQAINRIIDIFPFGEKAIVRNLVALSLQAVICQQLVKKIGGGRIAAFEIMLCTPAVRNLIREDKVAQLYSIMQTNRSLGMCTMEQTLASLAEKNLIAVHQAKFNK